MILNKNTQTVFYLKKPLLNGMNLEKMKVKLFRWMKLILSNWYQQYRIQQICFALLSYIQRFGALSPHHPDQYELQEAAYRLIP